VLYAQWGLKAGKNIANRRRYATTAPRAEKGYKRASMISVQDCMITGR